jgi:hypothetical protein
MTTGPGRATPAETVETLSALKEPPVFNFLKWTTGDQFSEHCFQAGFSDNSHNGQASSPDI